MAAIENKPRWVEEYIRNLIIRGQNLRAQPLASGRVSQQRWCFYVGAKWVGLARLFTQQFCLSWLINCEFSETRARSHLRSDQTGTVSFFVRLSHLDPHLFSVGGKSITQGISPTPDEQRNTLEIVGGREVHERSSYLEIFLTQNQSNRAFRVRLSA